MKVICMNKIKNVLLPAYLLISAMILLSGCGNDKTTTLFDPNVAVKPDPIITSVTPDSGLSGITELTITGQNFSAVKTENVVYFNTAIGTILSATATEIKIKSGVVAADSENVYVKVRVKGAIGFSNSVLMKLKQAVVFPFSYQSFEEPTAIEFDKDGNAYVSVLANSITNNIYKYTPAGVRSEFTPAAGGGLKYTSLKMGPDGAMYGLRSLQRAIFRTTQGVAFATWATLPSGNKLKDMDFDASGNLWLCGDNANLFKVSPTKVITSFPYTANALAIRVYNNALFVAVKKDSGSVLFKFPIDASGNIDGANPQLVVNVATALKYNVFINQFTMDIDGNIYLATNNTDPILKVTPTVYSPIWRRYI
jgi:hypothetical protein